jgi:hypothetical protein
MKTRISAAVSAWLLWWPIVSASQVTYPLPSGARDVEHSAIQAKANEQVAFWIQETFPSTSVVQHYERIFAGWPSCRQKGGGAWQSFPDSSRGPQVFVHEFARYWVSPNNSTAISLLLRYESERELSGGKPDNSRQVVYLAQYRTTDARKHFSEIGASCDKGT